MRKIRNKLMLMMMLLTLLPIVLIGAYSLHTTVEALRDNALNAQRNQLAQAQLKLQSYAAGVERDLLFLRDSSAMQLYLAAKQASPSRSDVLLTNLRNSALLFSQQQRIYSAIRLLDKQGNEIFRVENEANQTQNPKDEANLKNQLSRPFFTQVIQRRHGEVYISPLDLRQSDTRELAPLQPTIRYATVVQDQNDNAQGVLVLNLDVQRLINQLLIQENETWSPLLTDTHGNFFHHPDQSKLWRGKSDLNPEHNAFTAASSKLSRFQGSTKPDDITYNNTVSLSQPLSLGADRPALGYLFSIAPTNLLFKPLNDYLTISLTMAGISLLLSLVFALMLANSLSEPLESLKTRVEKLSQGDLETPIYSSSKNEIGDLSRAVELLRKSMKILMKRTRKASP